MTAAATRTLRAAVYVRISDDKGGQGLGVERQREDCLALIARKGWELVAVFDDNDISAFSGKARPGYLAMCEAVLDGRVDVIVAYRPDRLTRRTRELEDLIDLLDETSTTVETVAAGSVDLGTTAGRRNAKIMGAIAQGESEDIRDKVRRTMIQNAELGKPHGPTRTYGLDGTRRATEGWVIVEHEAAVIREAAERLLSGEGMLTITRDLNARGIPAPRGGQWLPGTLKGIVISARVCGWREHNPGRKKSDPNPFAGGSFVAEAEWPAILTRATVERLRRLLGDPARRRGPSGRTYLLSGGIAVCGRCGSNMVGQFDDGRREYRCNPKAGGCGRVRVKADDVEAYAVELVREAHRVGQFDDEVRDAAAVDAATDAAWQLVADLRADRDDNDADRASGAITRAQHLTINEGLTARLAAAESDLARRQETESRALLVGGLVEFERAWNEAVDAGALDKQRARLRAALVELRVGPALVPGRRAFDPDRVEPIWRG